MQESANRRAAYGEHLFAALFRGALNATPIPRIPALVIAEQRTQSVAATTGAGIGDCCDRWRSGMPRQTSTAPIAEPGNVLHIINML